jgi:hypothetical protein
MNHITPIELLKERLQVYERALQKSFEESQKTGDDSDFKVHKSNLEPKIFQYKQAINCLETWLD